MVVLPPAAAARPRFRRGASGSRPALIPAAPPLLLYDGHCALCTWTVRFVLRFDRHRTMRFAPLAGATAARVRAQLPAIDTIDSIILVRDGKPLVRSDAVLAVFRYLAGPWRVLTVGRLIPREIRDGVYDVIAFWRKRLFGRYEACHLPPPAHRERFLP